MERGTQRDSNLSADRPIVRMPLRRFQANRLHNFERGWMREVFDDVLDLCRRHAARNSVTGLAMCASQRGASPRLIGKIPLTHSPIGMLAVNRVHVRRAGQWLSLQRSNSSMRRPMTDNGQLHQGIALNVQ